MASHSGPLKLKNNDVLKPEPNAAKFNIYHRDENKKPDYRYPAEHAVTTCVVKSINICRGMLGQEKVREGFVKLACKFSKLVHPRPWFDRSPLSTRDASEAVTKDFIKMVLHRFPNVFVDDSFTSLDQVSCHCRHAWDTEFDTSNQNILVNGQSIQHMMGTAMLAQSPSPFDHDNQKDLRSFLFLYANAFLHELGHVFVTFLGKGRDGTPTVMRPKKHGSFELIKGESGFILEHMVFGGAINFYHNPDTINLPEAGFSKLIGTPYKYDGKNHYLIPQAVVDKTVSYRIDMNTVDKTVHLSSELSYAHKKCAECRDLFTIGEGMPTLDATEDPLLHAAWPALRDAPFPTDS